MKEEKLANRIKGVLQDLGHKSIEYEAMPILNRANHITLYFTSEFHDSVTQRKYSFCCTVSDDLFDQDVELTLDYFRTVALVPYDKTMRGTSMGWNYDKEIDTYTQSIRFSKFDFTNKMLLLGVRDCGSVDSVSANGNEITFYAKQYPRYPVRATLSILRFDIIHKRGENYDSNDK